MSVIEEKFDVLIVGAGLSGCVMAERFASQGKRVMRSYWWELL